MRNYLDEYQRVKGRSNPDGYRSTKKTGWDKASVISQAIEALAIPISIIVLIVQIGQFNAQQQSNSQTTTKQFQQNQQLAQNQQHQTTLDTYLDRMSDLLLTSDLAVSNPGDQVRAIAEARTYTAARNLDSPRKGTLVRFLWEAKLINGPQPIISLSGADLSGAIFTTADLSSANLSGANLSGTNLSGTNLSGDYFTGANLSGADLLLTDLLDVHMNNADLSGAYLYWANMPAYGCRVCSSNPLSDTVSGAIHTNAHLYPNGLVGQNLGGAPLEGAYLHGINLNSADLSKANLSSADLSKADLSCAKLGSGGKMSCADLSFADLSGANLSGANLSGVTLEDARNLTQQQLDQVSSCKNVALSTVLTCH